MNDAKPCVKELRAQSGALFTSATMATGVDAKLLKTTKFPPEFNQKVDMTKVNLQVMKKYVPPKSPEKHTNGPTSC